MCEHRFSFDLKDLKPVSKCTQCRIWELDALRQQLAAANAALFAETKKREQAEAFREEVLSNIEGAENETHVIEHLAKLRIKIYDTNRRAEQAEAQCVSMRNCANCRFVNCDMTCEIDDTTVEPSLSCEDWEEPIGIEIKTDRILAELQRYRSLSASSSAQRVTAGEQGAPFDEYCPNPDKEG